MDSILDISYQESYIKQFKKDGVFVFKQLMTSQALMCVEQEINSMRMQVMNKIATMPRPLKTYSDIAERQLGRFDYRCGFTNSIFDELALPIVTIIKTLSPQIDFRYYWGAIPSLGGSGPTDMHRDVYPILNSATENNLDMVDINLPPYYFTVLIPLMNMTEALGPTQFIKGSHTRPKVDAAKETIYAPLLNKGDVVIFDGRTLHKGSANQTKNERIVAYITFVANWYHDQTFEINNYLFPELSVPGR